SRGGQAVDRGLDHVRAPASRWRPAGSTNGRGYSIGRPNNARCTRPGPSFAVLRFSRFPRPRQVNWPLQREQFRILRRLFAFQNNQHLLGYRTTSELRSCASVHSACTKPKSPAPGGPTHVRHTEAPWGAAGPVTATCFSLLSKSLCPHRRGAGLLRRG